MTWGAATRERAGKPLPPPGLPARAVGANLERVKTY